MRRGLKTIVIIVIRILELKTVGEQRAFINYITTITAFKNTLHRNINNITQKLSYD